MNFLEDYIEGTCREMCPRRERDMREREGLLHVLEMQEGTQHMKRPKADPSKTAKEYCRSAAGQRMPKSSDLRPLTTLLSTVKYLLRLAYHPPPQVEWSIVYDFVADRLRAVRQDLVMQGLSGEKSLNLLESMVLFHVYAGYRLSDQDLSVFDPKLNNDWLLDCMKRSLTLYDLGANSKNQGVIEALYGIVGLGNQEALRRLVALPLEKQCNESKLAYQMVVAFELGNFIRGFRLLELLPAPLTCAVAPHLPALRRGAIQVLSIAYNNKVLRVKSDAVARWLALPSPDIAVTECSYYGLQCDASSICFQKSSLKKNCKIMQCSRLEFLDKKLNQPDILNIFSVIT